jgi:hypothetical protein
MRSSVTPARTPPSRVTKAFDNGSRYDWWSAITRGKRAVGSIACELSDRFSVETDLFPNRSARRVLRFSTDPFLSSTCHLDLPGRMEAKRGEDGGRNALADGSASSRE